MQPPTQSPANAITEHTPPTTTDASGASPPPPPSRCSHSPDVAQKRPARTLRAVHAMTQEPPQQRVATPKAKEGTDGTPCHVANGPKGPSALQVVTRCKRSHHGWCRGTPPTITCLG